MCRERVGPVPEQVQVSAEPGSAEPVRSAYARISRKTSADQHDQRDLPANASPGGFVRHRSPGRAHPNPERSRGASYAALKVPPSIAEGPVATPIPAPVDRRNPTSWLVGLLLVLAALVVYWCLEPGATGTPTTTSCGRRTPSSTAGRGSPTRSRRARTCPRTTTSRTSTRCATPTACRTAARCSRSRRCRRSCCCRSWRCGAWRRTRRRSRSASAPSASALAWWMLGGLRPPDLGSRRWDHPVRHRHGLVVGGRRGQHLVPGAPRRGRPRAARRGRRAAPRPGRSHGAPLGRG